MKTTRLSLVSVVLILLGLETSTAQHVQEIPKGKNVIIVPYAFCGSYDVPANSKGNSLVVSISNPINQMDAPLAMDEVLVWVQWPNQQRFPGKPAPTMIITPENQTVKCPAAGERTQAVFKFDVGNKVQPGDLDSLRIEVIGRTGPLLNKVAAIHFIGDKPKTQVSKSPSITITIK